MCPPFISSQGSGPDRPIPTTGAPQEQLRADIESPLTNATFHDQPNSPAQSQTVTPPTTRPARGMLSRITADLREAGATPRVLTEQLTRGVAGEMLRWGANLCLIAYGLQAATEGSYLVPLFIAGWIGASILATRFDYIWRTRMDELDRAYKRVLTKRLTETHGASSLAELDDEARQGAMELHRERRETISNLVESTIAIPTHLTRIALSAGALCFADWRVALAIGLAVLPGLIVKQRQVNEDIDLEDRQSRKAKVVDAISDEILTTHGSARMILGRYTERLTNSVNQIQTVLDSERNTHERRQARHRAFADALYYSVLGVSMMALFGHYQTGLIPIGMLGFLWLQLLELGEELDSHGDTAHQYSDLFGKVRRFYEFTEPTNQKHEAARVGLPFPTEHTLSLRSAQFVRGVAPEQFTVDAPDLELRPGSFLVIHGGNGAGKSTLERALAFGSRPEGGDFRIGDLPIQRIALSEWRKNVSYCGPTSAIQRGLTVRDALTLDPDADDVLLNMRCEHPLVKELINSLEQDGRLGLETRIGAGLPHGREFSSGELQRLMLVTALVPRRKIVFLDEVTSNQSEDFLEVFQSELAALRAQGSVVVLVTHSKRFDEYASHIMRVQKGKGELELVRDVKAPEPLKFVGMPGDGSGDQASQAGSAG